jgi:hypothetical protein
MSASTIETFLLLGDMDLSCFISSGQARLDLRSSSLTSGQAPRSTGVLWRTRPGPETIKKQSKNNQKTIKINQTQPTGINQ